MHPIHLYHVTPTENIPSIVERGLDPVFSKGKRPVIWLLSAQRVNWGLAHVSNRHKTPVNGLTLFYVTLDKGALLKTAWSGVFVSKTVIPVSDMDIAEIERWINDPDYSG